MDERGFTVLELLIVIVVIGLLTAIMYPSLTSVRERGYTAAVEADLRHTASAMVAYRAVEGRYPLDGELAPAASSPGVTLSIALPVDVDDADEFCLEGSHASLGGGVVVVYDTRAGGIVAAVSC